MRSSKIIFLCTPSQKVKKVTHLHSMTPLTHRPPKIVKSHVSLSGSNLPLGQRVHWLTELSTYVSGHEHLPSLSRKVRTPAQGTHELPKGK